MQSMIERDIAQFGVPKSDDAESSAIAAAPKAGSENWMSTKDASSNLGITLRTLYRLIDEGQLPAYKFGRVIRLKAVDVEAFVERARVTPGSLEHLYPAASNPAAPR